MKISRGSAYAVYGLRYLATRGLNEKVTISEIATSFDLPEKHLAKIFQGLAKTRLVNSVRGINGGFMLSTPPDEISLLDIVEAVEGPFDFENCMLRYGACDFQSECYVCEHLKTAHRSIMDVLRNVKLTNLIKKDDPSLLCGVKMVKQDQGDSEGESEEKVQDSVAAY